MFLSNKKVEKSLQIAIFKNFLDLRTRWEQLKKETKICLL